MEYKMAAPKISVSKTAAWYVNTMLAIAKAGGSNTVIDMFSPELIDTMIRNDLHIVFDPQIGNKEIETDQRIENNRMRAFR